MKHSNERESILYIKVDLQNLEKVELLKKQNKTKLLPNGRGNEGKRKDWVKGQTN